VTPKIKRMTERIILCSSKSNPEALKKKLNFTPLVMPADKILMQIKDEHGLKLVF